MDPSVLFILLVTVAGSASGIFSHCELSQCDAFPSEDIRRTMREFPPNEEELRGICPPLLETMDCVSSAIQECTGETLEELKVSENETLAQLMSTFGNAMSLMIDVCDEESQIGRDFRASAPCLKKIFSERNEECVSESGRLYDAFRFPEGYDAEEIMATFGDKLRDEMKCLTMAYEMACNLKTIQKTCGSVAKDVILQVVKRPKMLSMGICSEDALLTLKGQFLDFLEEQGEHRAFFANAFEFRKRRK